MLETGITLLAVLFGLAYLWLKAGDAMRAAWSRVKHWLPSRPVITSRRSAPRESFPVAGSDRSLAVERLVDRSGTEAGNRVPVDRSAVIEWLTRQPDDEVLTVLASMAGDVDGYRYADSRIGKFIGGRVEDRIAQVRAVRGKDAPPKPAPPPARVIGVNGRPAVEADW